MKRIGFVLAGATAMAVPAVAHADTLNSGYVSNLNEWVFDAKYDPGVVNAINTVNQTLQKTAGTTTIQNVSYPLLNMDADAQATGYVYAYTDNGQSFVKAWVDLAASVNAWSVGPAPDGTAGTIPLIQLGGYPSFEGDAHYWVVPWKPNQNYVATYWYTDLSGAELNYRQVGQPDPLNWTDSLNVPLDNVIGIPPVNLGPVSIAVVAGISGRAQLASTASLNVSTQGQANIDAHISVRPSLSFRSGPVEIVGVTLDFLDDSGTNGRKADAHAGGYLKLQPDDQGNTSVCAGYDVGYDIENAAQITMSVPIVGQQTLYAGFTPPPQSAKGASCYDLTDHQVHPPKMLIGQQMGDPTAQLLYPQQAEIDLPAGTSQYTSIYTHGWALAGDVTFELGPLPPGVTATLSAPRSLVSAGTDPFVDLTLTTTASAPSELAVLAITAHDGNLTYTTTMQLNVAPCVPLTCSNIGSTCGSHADGCGGTFDCGGCAAGSSCKNGLSCVPNSCVPQTCAQVGAQCGTTSDGCGDSISCGSCASGQACSLNHCCPTGTGWDDSAMACVSLRLGGGGGGGGGGKCKGVCQ